MATTPPLEQFADIRLEQEETKEETRQHCRVINKYLKSRLRITLTDGRVLVGKLECFDKLSNMILTRTEQLLEDEAMRALFHGRERRSLGTVLIGRKHMVKCEALEDIWNAVL